MDKKPAAQWNELYASTDFREQFRYKKGTRTRTYNVTPTSEGRAGLWVLSTERGKILNSRKLMSFSDRDDVLPVLQDIQRELRKGGWSEA